MDILNTKINNILTEKTLKVRPENIKSGVSIFGINGDYTGNLTDAEYSEANDDLDDILYQSQNVLPDTYQQVEYLESTGTQYLTIPYIVNNKTRLYCRYNQTNYGSDGVASVIFGVTSLASASSANNGIVRVLGGTTNSLNRVGWGGTADGTVKNIAGYNIRNNWYKIFFDLNEVYIDDTLVATLNQDPNEYWTAEYGLGIFARNGRSVTFASKARISSLWVKEDDYMINLIPCYRKSDNEAGMYDTVNNVFYTNEGTGDFIVGEDVNVLNSKIGSILTEKNTKILPTNIKAGVNILGVQGSYTGLDTSDANATVSDIVTNKTAYVNGSKITGSLVINKYYTGSGSPSSSLGNDGDLYLEV